MFGVELIDWVSGAPPVDEPECGYRRQRCIPPKRAYITHLIMKLIDSLHVSTKDTCKISVYKEFNTRPVKLFWCTRM